MTGDDRVSCADHERGNGTLIFPVIAVGFGFGFLVFGGSHGGTVEGPTEHSGYINGALSFLEHQCLSR